MAVGAECNDRGPDLGFAGRGSAQMATVAWAALSGNWSLATNWSGGSVPVAGDDVILPASNTDYTVTLDAGASPTPALDSLTIGGATDTGNITLDVGAQ